MSLYHKIHSIYKRDMSLPSKPFIEGVFSIPELEYLKDNLFNWDEKIDGTNIRIIFDGSTVEFRGRTDRADLPSHLLEELRTLVTVESMTKHFGDVVGDAPIILYGEGYGQKIQSGGNYMSNRTDGKKVSFILFDVRIGRWWLKRYDVQMAALGLGIDCVPQVGCGTILEAIEYVRGGFNSTFGDFMSEGLIIRPIFQLFDRQGNRIITKIKCKDFK